MNYHHAKFKKNRLKNKKSYRSLKLHFFQKKNNSINEQQYVKIWDV